MFVVRVVWMGVGEARHAWHESHDIVEARVRTSPHPAAGKRRARSKHAQRYWLFADVWGAFLGTMRHTQTIIGHKHSISV